MKLLIVDDNQKFRYLLRNLCEHLFEHVYECEDGDEAISLCRLKNPEWILMDIKMQRVDGFTAAKAIVKDMPAARIIIVSQYNDNSFVEEAYKSGAINFVNKEDLTKVTAIIKDF